MIVEHVPAAGGVELALWRHGSGRPLIIMAAAPWVTIDAAARIVASLSPDPHPFHLPGWQSVRYDMRGIGRSGGAFDPTLENQVADLAAVIAATGPSPVAIIASIHAGPAAITYAEANPRRVSHLTLWCSYARARDYFDTARFRAIEGVLPTDWDLFLHNYAYELLGWSGEEAQRFVPLVQQAGFAPQDFLRSWRAMMTADVSHLLPRLRVPLLVLHRERNPNVASDRSDCLADAVPGAHCVALPGLSQVPYLEHSDLLRRCLQDFLEDPGGPPRSDESRGRALTPREIDVLRLAALGLTNEQIAGRLGISLATVKNHCTSLFLKLGADNRTGAVTRARELGLLP